MSIPNDKVVHMYRSDKFSGYKVREKGNAKNSEERDVISMSDIDNTLFNELKADMREREERSRREISEREERFAKQMEQFQSDATKREERLSAEFKEREQRIINALDKLEDTAKTQSVHVESMKTQNFWGSIALFIGMLAIVITLIISVLS